MVHSVKEFVEKNESLLPSLAVNFEGLGANFGAIAEHLEALSRELRTFLLAKKNEPLSIRAVDKICDIERAIKEEAHPEELPPGSFLLNATFRTKKLDVSSKQKAVTSKCLNATVRISKFPSVSAMSSAIADIRSAICNKEVVNMAMFKQILPNFTENFHMFMNMDAMDGNIERLDGCFLFTLNGELNMEGIKTNFPAMLQTISHIKDVRFKVLKDPMKEFQEEEAVEYCDSADYAFDLFLNTRGNDHYFDLKFAISEETGKLMWFDGKQHVPKSEPDSKPSSYLIGMDVKMRVPQLCGSFNLPKIVMKGEYSEGLKVTLVHMAKESFFTRTVMRPIFSLPLLRSLMESNYYILFKKEEDDLILDAQIPLLPPPMIFSACLSLFVKDVLGGHGVFSLLERVLSSVAVDLKRLCNEHLKI